MPNMSKLGLFNIDGVTVGNKVDMPQALIARMREKSMGKDTTIGHWEIAGMVSPKPMPTYPNGFPQEVIEEFEKGYGEAHKTNSTEHTEELTAGVIINEEDLEVLARIIHGESGSTWCSDQMQLYVGSVFLNRVSSSEFPNTFEEVAFQDNGKQYSCTHKGSGYWEEPTERDYANAKYLLLNGSQLEASYLWQSNFKQGKDIIKVQNMYFGKK